MGRLPRATSPFGIFLITTLLGVLTALQAYNYVALVNAQKQAFGPILALNLTYWYSWGLLSPGVIWMTRHYRFERHAWRRSALFHVGAVILCTLLHVAMYISARGVILTNFTDRPFAWWPDFRERFFLHFDWEMMTYWAVVAFINALDYQSESRERELTAAQLQTQLAEAQLEALATSAPSAFSVQHAQHDFGVDAPQRPRRRRDAGAAQRSAAPDVGSHRHATGSPERRSGLPQEISRDRTDAIR